MKRIKFNRPFMPLAATLLVAWASAILWLSLVPRPPHVLPPALSWDKLLHAIAYALLTLLAGLVFTVSGRNPKTAWRLALLAALSYGGLIEVMQGTLTTGRQAECWDLAANAVGALLTCAGAWLWIRIRGGR